MPPTTDRQLPTETSRKVERLLPTRANRRIETELPNDAEPSTVNEPPILTNPQALTNDPAVATDPRMVTEEPQFIVSKTLMLAPTKLSCVTVAEDPSRKTSPTERSPHILADEEIEISADIVAGPNADVELPKRANERTERLLPTVTSSVIDERQIDPTKA